MASVYGLKIESSVNDYRTLLIEWKWDKTRHEHFDKTEKFTVYIQYTTQDNVWIAESAKSVDYKDQKNLTWKNTTYSVPENAIKVRATVEPVAEKRDIDKNNKNVPYFTGERAAWVTYDYTYVPDLAIPDAPEVSLNGLNVVVLINNYDFPDLPGYDKYFGIQLVNTKNLTQYNYTSRVADKKYDDLTNRWRFTVSVDKGCRLKVRVRAEYKAKSKKKVTALKKILTSLTGAKDESKDIYADIPYYMDVGWSEYSSEIATVPYQPRFTSVSAHSETSIRLEWTKTGGATKYSIEYANDEKVLGTTASTTYEASGENTTSVTLGGLETGKIYYFRIRAGNESSEDDSTWSEWSVIEHCIIGKKPNPPTIWASSTTPLVSDQYVYIYWAHNPQDGSVQTHAQLRYSVNGGAYRTIDESVNTYDLINISSMTDGSVITYQVRTQGILTSADGWSDWSETKQITVIAPPTVNIHFYANGESAVTDPAIPFKSFPMIFDISHSRSSYDRIYTDVTITANDEYDDIDNKGNLMHISVGDVLLQSSIENLNGSWVEANGFNTYKFRLSAGEINLKTPMSYRIETTIGFSSGISVTEAQYFSISFTDHDMVLPGVNAIINESDWSATLYPYAYYNNITMHPDDQMMIDYQWYAYARYNLVSPVYLNRPEDNHYFDSLPGDKPLIRRFTKCWELKPGETIHVITKTLPLLPRENGSTLLPVIIARTDALYTGPNPDGPPIDTSFYEVGLAVNPMGPPFYNELYGAFSQSNVYALVVETEDTTEAKEYTYTNNDEGSRYVMVFCEEDGVIWKQPSAKTYVPNKVLSIYRIESDGALTLIDDNIVNDGSAVITDAHPSLGGVRYRVIALDTENGEQSFYDTQSIAVNCTSIILQWEETVYSYNFYSDDDMIDDQYSIVTPITGSYLELPYDIDVSETATRDVNLVKYIGREYPVSYYGTQTDQKNTWNTNVPKADTETLNLLRRLQHWQGDVYVREPSGSGYWANVQVSFSQKHRNVIVPVTLQIARVERE